MPSAGRDDFEDPCRLGKVSSSMKTLLVMMCFSTLVGCSALNVKPPTGNITNMAVQDVNESGFTMNFNVDLANPNSIALR